MLLLLLLPMSTITTPSRSEVDVDDDDDDEEELPGGVALLLLLVLLNRRPVAISIITGAMSTDSDVKCDHRLTTTTEFSCIFYIKLYIIINSSILFGLNGTVHIIM
jgi:hypothetical protein